MNLSAIFIRRPVMTLLVMTSILFFGIVGFLSLPISSLPNVEYPTILVSAGYPGADPETMANTVTSPLEKKFTSIQGLKSLVSSSSNSSSSIVLQFSEKTSIDAAAQDVQAAISQAIGLLPQNLPFSPTYEKVNPAASPILYLTLTSSSMTIADLYDYGNTVIGQQLNTVPGVAQVSVYGSPYAVRIQVDPQKMAAKKISFDDLSAAIKSQNVQQSTGNLYGLKTEFIITVNGQVYDAAGYNNLIIKKQTSGEVVRVKDIGKAIDSLQNDKFYHHLITKEYSLPAVTLAIQAQPGANVLSVIKGIDKVLPGIEQSLPGSLKLHRVFDDSEYIGEAVRDVAFTLLLALILVVLVIFIYLGKIRDTLIPAVAIPMSIVGTFAVMSIMGFSIDILSLLALTLSIGFLVDDAIVVLENVVRHVDNGVPPFRAALEGSKEISFTIVSMTLCLASVFIPMLFMGGVLGQLFHEFAFVIFFAVLISGFISLSLTPMLASRFVPPHDPAKEKNKIEKFSERLNEALVSRYERSLKWVLTHRIIVFLGGVACFLLTGYLFVALPKNFLPPDDIGFIRAATHSSDATSPFQMTKYQQQVDSIVSKNPYVDTIISVAGTDVGNSGFFFARLKPINQRPPIQKIIKDLQDQLAGIPGVNSYLRSLSLINLDVGTGSSKGDYQFTLQSLDSKKLYEFTPIFMKKMEGLKGFSQITSDLEIEQPQVKLEILRDRASALGVTVQDIENALSFAYSGNNLTQISEPANQYYVIMETLPSFYRNPENLSQIYVRASQNNIVGVNGNLVPLNAVTTMTESLAPLSVSHTNGLPSVTISYNLQDVPMSTAISALHKLAKQELPPSILPTSQGTADVFQQTIASLGILLLTTIFIIYVILGILYENLFHPLTVMSTLPPAAAGGLLTLLIFGQTLSLYGFVGIIMLLGIVMKNGIILIDFANEAVLKHGKTAEEAILYAARVRFRPIIMTTVSALMGAVPIALGIGGMTAVSRRSLGLVIVGGLIISQILTLYLTPVTYLYLERLRGRFHKRMDNKLNGETPNP